jgi:hypothetical protein
LIRDRGGARPVGRVDRGHDRQTGRQDAVLLRAVEEDPEPVERQDRVEVPAVRQVVGDLAQSRYVDRGVEGVGVRRHVADRHVLGPAVAHGDLGDDQAGRGVEPDPGDRLRHLDHAGLDQHRGHPDGAVAAHRQAAGHLDVEHPPVGVGAGRRLQERAAHRGMTARLVHQEQPQVVVVREEVLAPLRHRRTGG